MTRRKTQKALSVAKYFIYKNNKEEKKNLTNKKLQKLLYYSQAWNLALYKKPLFSDTIEAWVHGPAVPWIYGQYKDYFMNNIAEKVTRADFSLLSRTEKGLLDLIWNVYGKYPADYLEVLTHTEDPWQIARENLEQCEPSTNEISKESMRIYYDKKLQEIKKKED